MSWRALRPLRAYPIDLTGTTVDPQIIRVARQQRALRSYDNENWEFAGFLGFAYYLLKQYSQALPWLRECASRSPNLRASHCWLAATYAQLGNIEKARAEAAEALRIDPRWTIEGAGMRLNTFKRAEDAEHYFDGLRKAGLPER